MDQFKISKFFKVSPVLIGLLIFCASSLEASENQTPNHFRSVLNFPAKVSNVAKYPVDQSIIYLEKTRFYSKVKYLAKKLKEYNFSVIFVDIDNQNFTDEGITFRNGIYESETSGRFVSVKHEVNDLVDDFFGGSLGPTTWFKFAPAPWGNNFDTGARIAAANLFDSGFYTALTFRYQSSKDERFYGIDFGTPDNPYTFHLEETSIDYIFGVEDVLPDLDFETGVGYSNVNVFQGTIHDSRLITEFQGDTGIRVPGRGGADLVSYGFSLSHDTRNRTNEAQSGGFEKLALTYNHGVFGDEKFDYWKVEADVRRYMRLNKIFQNLSDDKVFAFRTLYQKSIPLADSEVPFFDLARVGRDISRGYETNRFFDRSLFAVSFEYRYQIWKWKMLSLDSVLFSDFAWSFKNFDDMVFDEVKDSQGISFRFYLPTSNSFSINFARSDEDYQMFVKWKPQF